MEKKFTIEDLRNAFEAGENHMSAQWENDNTSTIGFYNGDAEIDFDSWFKINFKNETV